jgi:hypothetical protein
MREKRKNSVRFQSDCPSLFHLTAYFLFINVILMFTSCFMLLSHAILAPPGAGEVPAQPRLATVYEGGGHCYDFPVIVGHLKQGVD